MSTVKSSDPRQRAFEAMKRLIGRTEPKHIRIRAIAGDGAGNVAAVWPGYYWVRLVGKTEMVVQAFCDTMIPGNGMHIYVEEEHREGQRFYRIVGKPDSQGWFTNDREATGTGSPVPGHHIPHETGGDDMINVGPYMIENLRGGPTSPPSMVVRVSWAPNVIFGREAKPFPGTSVQYKDSAALTAPTWGERFDIVSVDSDLDINVAQGAVAWTGASKPACPKNEIPVCWTLVKSGDTTLDGTRFWPANSLHAVGILHAADHEDGGDDEMSVGGLGGVLADAQNADHLQGNDVATGVPDDNDVLTWDTGASEWAPAPGGGGGGHTVQEEGAPLAQRTNLNFVGAGVTATDDAVGDATIVTVPGGIVITTIILGDSSEVLATGTDRNPIPIEAPCDLTIIEVRLKTKTAPATQAIIVDIHVNAVTIFTNQANRPEIAAAATEGNTTTIDLPTLVKGDNVTFDTDQVGIGTTGGPLMVEIICEQIVEVV